MTEKLLPCPFCGGDRLKHFGKEIQCQQCQALGPLPADGEVTRQIATDWWNRRAPTPQTNLNGAIAAVSDPTLPASAPLEGQHRLAGGTTSTSADRRSSYPLEHYRDGTERELPAHEDFSDARPSDASFEDDAQPITSAAPVQHVRVADFANRLFDLHGFMLLHSAGSDGKPTITISFPDLKEAQQFHSTLVELSQHRTANGGSADVR